MASFTDKPMQFNPYIQQLPVEEMVKVGMIKQDQYDKGVQKIQGQIDQVAGLDIYKDVDKAYLQSKLNQLGGNLTTVAAGDFSNFQLVNSVGGMVKQIGNDKIVQTAVGSTAWLRKQTQEMEAAIKAGKSSQENIYDFNKKRSEYASSTEVGESFNGRYTPYTDVFKKLEEIAKSVGVDSKTVQMLFRTDANGDPELLNGRLQYNDVMAETLLKGKDRNKILSAFQVGLSTDDYNQLAITGKYKLQGKSKDDLLNMNNENFKEYKKDIILQQDYIDNRILAIKTNNGPQEQIDALDKKKLQLKENLTKRESENASLAALDEDALRANIYTSNFIDSASFGFTEKETYTKYSKNPAVEIMMDRERLKIAKNTEARQLAEFEYKQRNDVNQRTFDWKKIMFEKGLIDENGKPTGGNAFAGPARDANPSDQTNGSYFIDQFGEGLKTDMEIQRQSYEKVAIAHWIATNKATGKNFTEPEMKQQIKETAESLGFSYNDYIIMQGRKAVETFHNTKTSPIGNQYNQDFANIDKLEKVIALKSTKLKEAENFVKEASKTEGFQPVDLSKFDIKPVTVSAIIGGETEGRGPMRKENITLSKEDVFNFSKVIYNTWEGGFIPGFLDSDKVKRDSKVAQEKLVAKYGMSGFMSMKDQLKGDETFQWSDANPFQLILGHRGDKQNPEVKKALNAIKDDNYTKTLLAREQYFKNISQVGVPKTVVLYKDKPEAKNHLVSTLASVAGEYAGIDDSYKKIVIGANDDKSQFQINIDPAGSIYGKNAYTLQMTEANGTVVTKPITSAQYSTLTRMEAPLFIPSEIESSINAFSSRTGSTNSTYSYTDPNNAFSTALVKDNETNTNRYNVAIDYAKGTNGNYFPKIYVKVDSDWKLVEYNPSPMYIGMTAQEAEVFPSAAVDDNFINSLLLRKK